MSYTIRALSRRRLKPARPAHRTRLALETLEDRNLLSSSISGFVYIDVNNNGIRDVDPLGLPEPPIQDVTLQLTGTDDLGNAVNLTTTSGIDGSYTFFPLLPSDPAGYTLMEVQPSGFLPGRNAVGTVNGTVNGNLAGPTVDTITGIHLADLQAGINYDFGELQPASMSGVVYVDSDNNGFRDSNPLGITEPPIPGVTLKLTGTDDLGNAVSLMTTTGTDGLYSFANLRPSNAAGYTLAETQPTAYLPGRNAVGTVNGVTVGNLSGPVVDTITGVKLNSGDAGVDYDFGELPPSTLAGFVYVDANNDGIKQAGEPAVSSVTITLTGTDDLGGAVNSTKVSISDGSYTFSNLRPGSYTLTETLPSSYVLGKTTPGNLGGTSGSTFIAGISLTPGVNGSDNNFGLLVPSTISGVVFADYNNNGVQNGIDFRLSGVTLTLTGSDGSGNLVTLTTTSAADGSYRFGNLAPGTYTLTDVTPATYFTGKSIAGSAGGTAAANQVTDITLTQGIDATAYNFAAVPPVSAKGSVYIDYNGNGIRDASEPGIAGVQVLITGTDVFGGNVFQIQTTDNTGLFQFSGLAPGFYNLTEGSPIGYFTSQLQNGTPAAASVSQANRQFAGIDLTNSAAGSGYNFAHLVAGFPVAVNPVGALFPQVIPTFSSLVQLVGNGPINNVVFVNALYQQLLGRQADVDGVNYWTFLLDIGITRTQVAAGFWQSVEHRGLQVDLLYLTLLHRGSDAAGKVFWINAFLQGAGETDVASQMMATTEYAALHSSNAAFVTALYQDALIRTPDGFGLNFWQQQLQGGASRADVARAILTSQEGSQKLLDRYYLQYLGRTPDSVAEQVWLTPLQHGGLSTSAVAEMILASDEFLARAKTFVM